MSELQARTGDMSLLQRSPQEPPSPHVDLTPKLCPECGMAFRSNQAVRSSPPGTGSTAIALLHGHLLSKTDGAQRVVVVSGAA